ADRRRAATDHHPAAASATLAQARHRDAARQAAAEGPARGRQCHQGICRRIRGAGVRQNLSGHFSSGSLVMTSNISLRPAGRGDMAATRGTYAHAVPSGTASFELEPPSESEMARRQQGLLARRFPYIVAERAGAVVGYAYAGPYRDRRAY